MSWASSEWKVGLPSSAQVKISELETQLEKLQKDRQQRQLQVDRLEALVDGQKKKHEDDRLRVLSMEKEIVQLNTNMEENIRQLLKAQQEVLAKDRNLLNYQNQLDAQKRLHDQELVKVKRLELELEQQRAAMRSCSDPNELTMLHKRNTELENLRSKQEELIKQLESKISLTLQENKNMYGQAGDHNHLEETISRLEKECEGLKAANSRLEIELWSKNNSDSDCALNTCRTPSHLLGDASKIQLQLEDAKTKICDLENSRQSVELAYTKLEQEMQGIKFGHDQEVEDLRSQLEESENNFIQEKRAVEAIKNYLKDSETKSRLLEEEINELRLHVQNSNSNMLVNQELLSLRDRCVKQAEQIKQFQMDAPSDHEIEKFDKLQELLERRETEIKHLTKAQKDQDNQLQLMQKKLHAGEELIHSMNLIVNEHKTKCVDDKLEFENCKEQLKESVQTIQMLEIEKRQLKKAIQIKESIVQSLMKGDADSSKGMLKNQLVELRLKCEEYENKISELNDELKSMQRSSKDDKSTYSSPKYADSGLLDKNRDLENELKIKQMQLEECVLELNSFRDVSYSPGSSSSELPNSFTRKFNEKDTKLNATLLSLEKVTNQLSNREKELKLTKQRCESLEKDYYGVSSELEALQKMQKMLTPTVDIGQMEVMRTELHKKDKLIRHLQSEMNALQNLTLQIEDFQNSIKERDEKIFQLETDLDSEQRLKEERNLAVLTQQNKIKTLQSELDEKDSTIAEMRNVHDENEMSTQYLRTIQANLQTELQEKENQCSVLQLELNKVQNICQEVESGNRTLQCQVEELKNRLEKVTMDKEESDNNVSCLQMELFNLKNELQTTYKSAEKAREKMDHKTNEIVALSVELEKKERHIISQQIQLDKLLRSHEEQDACIHSLMSRLTSLQSDIEEKEKSSGIFSLQPDFLSSKTGLNPKVLQAELWAMKSQLESKEKQLEKARLHLEERDGSIQFLRTLLVTLQNDLEDKEKTLKSVQQQLNCAEENVRKQETVNFDLQKQLKSALKENEEKMTKITAALNEVELTHRDQEDKKTRIQNLRSQMHTMQTKLESTLKEKEEKKSTISALRSQIQSLQNKIQMAQKDREDKRACIQALQSELQVLQDEVDVSRKVNDKKEHKIQLLNTQLGAIKLELEEREKIINTLHGEMASLRQSDQEKDSAIDKLTLQLQTVQSKFENSCMAVQSLQNEVQSLKNTSIKEIKENSPSSQNKKNFESYVQMLVSEMESMQYTLQSTQSEWEEKEDAFHAIANHVHKLQAKLEDKKMITNNLEQELTASADQTKECRLRCLVMETQLLQDELETKEAALMDATQQLRQSGEQRRRVEQEVSKLLTEMEEIQQGQEKSQQSVTPDNTSEDRKEGSDDPISSRQLKMQLVQANSRIEILMSDSEEMRNAMEILEFEKLELQESQETLLCENQNLKKKIQSLESEVEQLRNLDGSLPTPNKQACSLCNEYLKEIMALKDLKESNNLKIKEQDLELIRTNQELNSLTTTLDVQKASLLAITEERDKAVFELSLIERENGNQASPTETLMFQLEMKAQKETMYARVQEIVSKFVLTVKEHCTLANEHGLSDERLVVNTEPKEDDDESVLRYLIIQHQHILYEIIEFKRSAHSKVKEMEENQKSYPITICNLKADKLQLSQLLNDKISQLEDVLKSLESLTERTLSLEREKDAIVLRADERISTLEKQNNEASLCIKDKNQLLEENLTKIDAMTKTISSMAVYHKEHCDELNVKLKQMESERMELERHLEENREKFEGVATKYQMMSEKKDELSQNLEVLLSKLDEIQAEKAKLTMRLDKEMEKVEVLGKEKDKLMEELSVKMDELSLRIQEKNVFDDRLGRSKEFFETVLGDLEMNLSDLVLSLKSEGSDWCLVNTTDNKTAIGKCSFPQFDPSAEKLEHLRQLVVKLRENLNNVLAAHEDTKSELLCTLMKKNQSLQIESEKNVELETCIIKLNEELMEFKDSLESEKLELVERHFIEIDEMKGQVEMRKQIEENNKVLFDTMSAKLGLLEEEKTELLENVSQNAKSLEHRKAQLSSIKQDLKLMKKEKEQIIGIILVREETIKDLEQKLKKLVGENKLKCETIYRHEQTIHGLEDQWKLTEGEKCRLTEVIKNLTEKVADIEDAKTTALERSQKLMNLENKFVSITDELVENEKRFESAESQLRMILGEQVAKLENNKLESLNKIEELEERVKEEEYELQREKENHAIDNARKSNCEVDLKEKIDALNVTIQQLQLEKADLLLTTTERISELEDISSMQIRQLDDVKGLLDESVRVGEGHRKRAEKLEKEVENWETDVQNWSAKSNKLEDEKLLLQQALTEKVELLEKERGVIFDQLQDLEKVKNKLMSEVRDKDGRLRSFEEMLNDTVSVNKDLEKLKFRLSSENREKDGKIIGFEERISELVATNQELEKIKMKLRNELFEREEKIVCLEDSVSKLSTSVEILEKNKNKLVSEVRDTDNLCEDLKTELREKDKRCQELLNKCSDVGEELKRYVSLNQELNKEKAEFVSNTEKIVAELNEKDEQLKQALQSNEELEKLKIDMIAEICEKEECLRKNWTTNQELEDVTNNLQSEISEKEKELQGTINTNQELENTKCKLIKEIRDKQIQINNFEEHLNDTVCINQAQLAQLGEKDERIQTLEENLVELEHDLQVAEGQIENLQKNVSEKDEMIASYEKSNQEGSCLIDTLKETISKLELEKEFAVRAFDDENRRCSEVQRCVETHCAATQQLKSENLNLTTIVQELQIALTKLKEEKDTITAQLNNLSENYSKCVKDLNQLTEASAAKILRIEALQNENQRTKDQLQDMEQNVAMLTESKRSLMTEFMLQKEEKDTISTQFNSTTENYSKCAKELSQLTEASAADLLRIEALQNKNQHLKDQLQDMEQNVVMLTESKRSLMAEFKLHKEEKETIMAQLNNLSENQSKYAKDINQLTEASTANIRRIEALQNKNQRLKDQLQVVEQNVVILTESKRKLLAEFVLQKEEKDTITSQLDNMSENYLKCVKDLNQLTEASAANPLRIEALQNENQRLKDQLQVVEQNVVLLTESKRNLMAEFMLQKEESNKLNEQITDLTLELERRLHHHEAEKGTLDELQTEVDIQTDHLESHDSYLVLMMFKEKLESQLASATSELAELRDKVSLLQGDAGSSSSLQQSGSNLQLSSDQKDFESSQSPCSGVSDDKNSKDL